MTYCWRCKGRIHVTWSVGDRVRLGCYNRSKEWSCDQPSAAMQVFEGQLRDYLKTFQIPEDYQTQILDANKKLGAAYGSEAEKERLSAQHKRVGELYEWGDLPREAYLLKRESLERRLKTLTPTSNDKAQLERLAAYLADVVIAWEAASQDQRNQLVRCLLEEVWLTANNELATRRGFEPPISTVTGWHVRPLHHRAVQIRF